jgi:cardiolipin synthase
MAPHSASRWLTTGDAAFAAMLEAMDRARTSLRLEMYIYEAGPIGDQFRQALIQARQRGVSVHVLIDALGSQSLPTEYWTTLVAAGAVVRRFNPLELRRLPIRNHRKLLVCDSSIAFVGGFNIASEYQGDGIRQGWRDIGVVLQGPIARALEQSFDPLFERAGERPRRFAGLRRTKHPPPIDTQDGRQLLLGIPGRGAGAIQISLLQELARPGTVRLIVPYFLPGTRLRRAIQKAARRGHRVQLIVPGQTDVPISKLAAQSLYGRLLRSGVEIYEYQPQILHAKLFLFDRAVFVGSSNLDTRSLHLNYELLVRLEDSPSREAARDYFESALAHSTRVEPKTWGRGRSLWTQLRERWAWFLLARVDPWVARWLTQS